LFDSKCRHLAMKRSGSPPRTHNRSEIPFGKSLKNKRKLNF
jgi:hypothetical protein